VQANSPALVATPRGATSLPAVALVVWQAQRGQQPGKGLALLAGLGQRRVRNLVTPGVNHGDRIVGRLGGQPVEAISGAARLYE